MLVVDRVRMLANVDVLARSVGEAKTYRVVVKSLPSVPLLREVMQRARTSCAHGLPSAVPERRRRDVYRGRRARGQAAARSRGRGASTKRSAARGRAFDPARQLQWLVDSRERLEQYLGLACDLGVKLRVNAEIDVGLHRGGLPEPAALAALLERIAAHPEQLEFAGLMGYEPHLTGVADSPAHPARAGLVLDRYRAFVDVARDAGHDPAAPTLNGAGSHNRALYENARPRAQRSRRGLRRGEADGLRHGAARGQRPGAVHRHADPQALRTLTAPVPELAETDLTVVGPELAGACMGHVGGYWKARYVSPSNVPVPLYHSTNQEPLSTSVSVDLQPDDHVFLRPTQSEAVMLQFGDLRVVEDGAIVERWPIFEMSASLTLQMCHLCWHRGRRRWEPAAGPSKGN